MDSLGQRLEIKSKLAESINSLRDEKIAILARMSRLKETKRERRDILAQLKSEIMNLKLSTESQNDQAAGRQDIIADFAMKVDKFQQELAKDISLNDYGEEVNLVANSIEQSIELYRDESLQMELKKKKNTTKDLRIEYHNLDKQYNDLKEALRAKVARARPVEKPVQVVEPKPIPAPVEKRTFIPIQQFSASQMLRF